MKGEADVPKSIAIGSQCFSDMRQENCFLIDKTMFIKDWWENKDSVTLITRPRRFGKTLNMDMMNCFFSKEYKNRADLFEGLKIWEYEEYRKMQGTYPVIFLSFAGVKDIKYSKAVLSIGKKIRELYLRMKSIIKSNKFDEIEKEEYRSYMKEITEDNIFDSLNVLCRYIYQRTGKKIIIFLDEYDAPLQEAYVNGYWDEMSQLMRNLLNNTFKTNEYLSRAILTGITRVSKESMFSDLNNLRICTMSSEEYSEYFGFTEDEVFESMQEYGYTNKDEVKYWYDGFKIGNKTGMYNPWSIINFLKTGKLEPYWSNTSSNSLAGKLLKEGDAEQKQDFEKLLRGETISKEIDEDIVFNQLDEDSNAVWSLLASSGYLKTNSIEDETYELEIVNHEVMRMFRKLVKGWFSKNRQQYGSFIRSLLKDDVYSSK